MIQKYLIDEDYEKNFKELNASKQLKYYQLCNEIENESRSFIIAADITPGVEENLCSVVKMHYEDGIMIWDSTVTF